TLLCFARGPRVRPRDAVAPDTEDGGDGGGDAMNATCECGMTLEAPARRTGCQECGTVGCRSCSIEVDTITYCRWCATSVAPRRAACGGDRSWSTRDAGFDSSCRPSRPPS